MTIVDDRLLARCAFEAVGWTVAAAPDAIADMAVGNAITSLRVLGVTVGPEILRTVRNDIALILADPEKIARAETMAASAARNRPSHADRAVAGPASSGLRFPAASWRRPTVSSDAGVPLVATAS